MQLGLEGATVLCIEVGVDRVLRMTMAGVAHAWLSKSAKFSVVQFLKRHWDCCCIWIEVMAA